MRWFCVLAVVAGCSRASEENLGLAAQTTHVDVRKLERPEELLRALSLAPGELDRRLGARRVEARSSLEVTVGGRSDKLDETWLLDSDGAGALHVVHDNSREGGMEAVVTGGELYVKPRHGKFIRRRPEGDELERLRALVEKTAHGYLELLASSLVVKEAGAREVAGRAGKKLALSGVEADPPSETASPRKWRESVKVRSLSGEVVVDPASGALLACGLEASYSFIRSDDKEPVTVILHFSYDTNAAVAIAAPADWGPAPRRPRPLLDKAALLEGLK